MTSLLDTYSTTEFRRLVKVNRELNDGSWPTDRPMTFDGSAFPSELREEAACKFLSAVRQYGKGRTLKMRNIQLTGCSASLLEEIFSSATFLKSLWLYKVSVIGMDGKVVDLFQSMSNLTQLSLECCILSQEMSISLGRRIEDGPLESLDLINMELPSETMPLFDGLAGSGLVHMGLRDVRVEDKCLSSLLLCLERCDRLTSLTLEGCQMGPTCADHLGDLLAKNSSLKTLCLGSNDLDANAIKIICERGLLHNNSLKKLWLSNNPFADAGAEHLTKLLCSNATIEYLTIEDCEIWGPGCQSLARGLAFMKGLKYLVVDCEWENYTDDILRSLESNMTLTHLWTDRMPSLLFSEPKWRLIYFYLRLNGKRRRILVDSSIPCSLWPKVLCDVSHDPSFVFHMLRSKPDLLSMQHRSHFPIH